MGQTFEALSKTKLEVSIFNAIKEGMDIFKAKNNLKLGLLRQIEMLNYDCFSD